LGNAAGCRSQAGPGAPVFREGRRNFLVPVARRSARSWLQMESTSVKQFSRFLMPFQWHKGPFYVSFISVFEAAELRIQVVGFCELLSPRGRLVLSAEGRGEDLPGVTQVLVVSYGGRERNGPILPAGGMSALRERLPPLREFVCKSDKLSFLRLRPDALTQFPVALGGRVDFDPLEVTPAQGHKWSGAKASTLAAGLTG